MRFQYKDDYAGECTRPPAAFTHYEAAPGYYWLNGVLLRPFMARHRQDKVKPKIVAEITNDRLLTGVFVPNF